MKCFYLSAVLLLCSCFSFSQESDLFPIARLDAGYAVGKFIGLRENYGEVGLFMAQEFNSKWLSFLDCRSFFLQRSNHLAATAGVGVRYLDECFGRVWGGNVFYDYRQGRFDRYDRLGFGLESLSNGLDIRINSYFPIGSSTGNSKPYFVNQMKVREKEFIYGGIDGEVGGILAQFYYFNIYGAVGPYYYHHHSLKGIYGGQARLEIAETDWNRYAWLEVRLSHDNRFNTHVEGKVLLSFPLDRFFCYDKWGACSSDEYFIQPVRRFGIPFTTKKCSKKLLQR